MATMVYSMMVALGEMATLFPVAGAFTHYASRFVDESLGFVSFKTLAAATAYPCRSLVPPLTLHRLWVCPDIAFRLSLSIADCLSRYQLLVLLGYHSA
jgi:amino acid transporter